MLCERERSKKRQKSKKRELFQRRCTDGRRSADPVAAGGGGADDRCALTAALLAADGADAASLRALASKSCNSHSVVGGNTLVDLIVKLSGGRS